MFTRHGPTTTSTGRAMPTVVPISPWLQASIAILVAVLLAHAGPASATGRSAPSGPLRAERADSPTVRLTAAQVKSRLAAGDGRARLRTSPRPTSAGSTCTGVDFKRANLTGARLADSKLAGANLFSCDLTDAIAHRRRPEPGQSRRQRAPTRRSPEGQPRGREPLRHDHRGGRPERRQPVGHAHHRLPARAPSSSARSSRNANIGADPGNQSMGVMRATFVSADLSGADFTGANLFKADFSHATLAGARLVARRPEQRRAGADRPHPGRPHGRQARQGQPRRRGFHRRHRRGPHPGTRPGPQPRQGHLRCEIDPTAACVARCRPGARPRPPAPRAAGGRRARRRRPAAPSQAAAPAGPALLAYVTNEDSQELSVIDTRTDSVVATIPVGTRPRGVRVSPDGKTDLRGAERIAQVPADHARRGVREAQGRQVEGRDRGGGRGRRKVTRVLPGGSDPETSTSAATAARSSSRTRMRARRRSWTWPAARSARP